MPHNVASDLGLHCWLMTILLVPGKNGLRRTCQQAIELYRWPAVNFKLTWTKSRKSYCTTPSVSVGVGIGSSGGGGGSKKFNVKVFYVMGKALSGELSCACDRSCCDSGVLIILVFMVSFHPSLLKKKIL